MKLTAIYTDGEGNKNKVMTREDYETKAAFKRDLEANGYTNIRIYTDEDFAVMDKGIYKTVRSKKIHENMMAKYDDEENEKCYEKCYEKSLGYLQIN